MAVKEINNSSYDKRGSVTKYGSTKLGADEEKVVNHYTNEATKGVDLGNIQRVDNMLRNINMYIKEIEDNFYNCLYEPEELNSIFSELKTAEQAMFRTAKTL